MSHQEGCCSHILILCWHLFGTTHHKQMIELGLDKYKLLNRNRNNQQQSIKGCQTQEQRDQNVLYHSRNRLTKVDNDSSSLLLQSSLNLQPVDSGFKDIYRNLLHLCVHKYQHLGRATHLRYQKQHQSSTFFRLKLDPHILMGQSVHKQQRKYTICHSMVKVCLRHMQPHCSPKNVSLLKYLSKLQSFY